MCGQVSAIRIKAKYAETPYMMDAVPENLRPIVRGIWESYEIKESI